MYHDLRCIYKNPQEKLHTKKSRPPARVLNFKVIFKPSIKRDRSESKKTKYRNLSIQEKRSTKKTRKQPSENKFGLAENTRENSPSPPQTGKKSHKEMTPTLQCHRKRPLYPM